VRGGQKEDRTRASVYEYKKGHLWPITINTDESEKVKKLQKRPTKKSQNTGQNRWTGDQLSKSR